MRGAVSLAVALAIPLETDAGAAFPQRDLIIFLTFAVIFFTLVVQGLSLPALIHRLGRDRRRRRRERGAARPPGRDEGRDRPDRRCWAPRNGPATRRSSGCARCTSTESAASPPAPGKIEDDGYEDRSLAYQQMVQIVLSAQRDALLRLRADGDLSNEAMNRILRELDLEESRLEI